jgi:quinoprotein glucose dehydrogenase
MPGLTGVIDWGGVSIDLDRNILVANYMTLPWRGRLIPRAEVSKEFAAAPLASLAIGTPFAWKFGPWLGPAQVPCSQPPWGSLTAIDLNSRRVVWNHAVGTGEDTGPFGISSKLRMTIGVPSLSGTLTTRGGLIFLSGTADQYLRGFDLATGMELWKARLPAGGQATPMTYVADGRQFIVISAGGNMLMRTKFGDYTIAYALPRHGT